MIAKHQCTHKNLPAYHFYCYKSHLDWPGNKSKPQVLKAKVQPPALMIQKFQVPLQTYKTRATDAILTINEKNILVAERKCQMSCLSKKSKISQGWL
jgi:hypothetical protein